MNTMNDLDDEPAVPVFHDLAGLLCYPRKVSIATLATAIERDGIQGWDRFGRFKTFKVGDDPENQMKNALETLAAQYAWESNDGDPGQAGEQSPLDQYDPGWGRGTYFGMGWREDVLPNFKDPDEEQAGAPVQPKRNPSAGIKVEGNNLRIIGGLLAYIKGELGNASHPDYKTEGDLIDVLADKLEGYAGLKPRNLQDKFAEAKRLLK